MSGARIAPETVGPAGKFHIPFAEDPGEFEPVRQSDPTNRPEILTVEEWQEVKKITHPQKTEVINL